MGGLEEPMFAVKTNEDRYTMLLDHLERDDATSKLLKISMGHAQIAIGSGTALFQLRYKEHEYLLPETWIKNLWEFTSTCRSTITIPNIWIPQLQRLGDRYVMDVGLRGRLL